MPFFMTLLAKNDKFIGTIRPRICIAIDKMMDLKLVPFIWKATAAILTGEVSLFYERIRVPFPIIRLKKPFVFFPCHNRRSGKDNLNV